MTPPSTPEADDDFDPTEPTDLDVGPDVADLVTDPLDAVLAAEGAVADLTGGLDEALEVDLDADDLGDDLEDDELDDELEDDELEDDDLEDDELEDDDTEELEDGDEDAADEDLTAATADVDGDDVVPSGLALDPAFEEDDEDLAVVVVGDDDEDEDVDGIRDGEFVCRSCFLAKRDTQLADPERMLCRDCA